MSWTIIEQSKTGDVQYMIATYEGTLTNGLTSNELRNRITTGITLADSGTPITITIPQSSIVGDGVNAIFTLVTDGAGVISTTLGSVTAVLPGSGYAIGNVITFSRADLIAAGFNATTSGNLVLTLTNAADIEPLITSSAAVNISGYETGTISATSATATDTLSINGSLNGTNYMILHTPAKIWTPATNFDAWSISVKSVIFGANVAGLPFTNLCIICSTGGTKFIEHGNTTAVPGPKPPLTSVQYNDLGFVAGAGIITPGVFYNAATTTQIQLGTTLAGPSTPTIAFSDGTHPAGNYDSGIYVAQANGDGNIVAFSTGDEVIGGWSDGFGTAGTSLEGVKPGFTLAGEFHYRRISGTGGNTSWEDGYFGNSSRMIFTPDDFGVSGTTAALRPTGVPLTNNYSVCLIIDTTIGRPSWPEFTFQSGDSQLVAMRLIPKGFQIPITDAGDGWLVKSTSTTSLGGPGLAQFRALKWIPPYNSTNMVPLGNFAIMNTWSSGNNTQFASNVVAEGDGKTFLVLIIITPNSMACNNGLAGVYAPLEIME